MRCSLRLLRLDRDRVTADQLDQGSILAASALLLPACVAVCAGGRPSHSSCTAQPQRHGTWLGQRQGCFLAHLARPSPQCWRLCGAAVMAAAVSTLLLLGGGGGSKHSSLLLLPRSIITLCIFVAARRVAGLQDGLAQQPPMGWRSCVLSRC
jgi:hypothetical protein